jgi:hypothetical protein
VGLRNQANLQNGQSFILLSLGQCFAFLWQRHADRLQLRSQLRSTLEATTNNYLCGASENAVSSTSPIGCQVRPSN